MVSGRPTPKAAAAALVLASMTVVAMGASLGLWGNGYAEFVAQPHLPPSLEYLAGTDALGRDVWARLVQGASVSMWTGASASALVVAVGAGLGALAGLRGGTLDTLLRSLADGVSAFPAIVALLALGLVLEATPWQGPGWMSVPIAIGLTQWPGLFRAVRTESKRLGEADFTLASKAMGAGPFDLLRYHVLPHLRPLLAASLASSFAWAVKAEAVLGFLGLSSSRVPGWGEILAEGASELSRGIWWPVVFAGGALFLVVAAAQVLADALAEDR